LLHIACSQIKEVLASKPDAITSGDLSKWFEEWSVRAHKATFRLKSQDFDPEETYRKYFKRLIDFYD